MKRKRIGLFALIILLAMMLCACSETVNSTDNNNYSVAGNNAGNGNSDDNYKSDKPYVKMVIYDSKTADFILDLNTLIDVDGNELESFTFYLSDGYEIEWFAERTFYDSDLGREIHEEGLALLYHDAYAGLGDSVYEMTGTNLVIHFDLNETPLPMDHFSFNDFSGKCTLFYNPPENTPEEYNYSHEYYYEFSEIADASDFVSDAEKDKRSWISGIWVSGPNEDTERGGMAKSFYIFNTDGTWNWVYILDSIENGKEYSVEDNFEKWFSKSKSVKRQTYTYDGETLLFTPSTDFRDRVELLLDNNSFTLEFDFGKYVVEGHQNGSETYTLYRKFGDVSPDELPNNNTSEGGLNIQPGKEDSKFKYTVDDSLLTRLISNPDDAIYFKPASDDYIYKVDYIEGDTESDITLMSFDDSGNLIQYVTRKGLLGDIPYGEGFDEFTRKDGEYFGTSVLSADTTVHYIDELDYVMKSKGNCSRTDKFYYINEYYLNYSSDEGYYIYISKKLDDVSTLLSGTNCDTMKWLEELKTLASEYGSDYYIKTVGRETHTHKPEYFTYENEKILKCGEYAVDTFVIFIFGEDGQVVNILDVNVFADEEQVTEYIYAQIDVSLDYDKRERSVRASELQKFYETNTVRENLIYNQREEDLEYKWSNNFIYQPDYYDSFYSVPFLTEKQIDKYYSEVCSD